MLASPPHTLQGAAPQPPTPWTLEAQEDTHTGSLTFHSPSPAPAGSTPTWSPVLCICRPCDSSASLVGSAEPTPRSWGRGSRREGCLASHLPQLRSLGGKGRGLCSSRGQGSASAARGLGTLRPEPQVPPPRVPSQVLGVLLLCYLSQPHPCHRRPSEAKHPAALAALPPTVTSWACFQRGLPTVSRELGKTASLPVPLPCHPSATQTHSLLSLRLSAQDTEAVLPQSPSTLLPSLKSPPRSLHAQPLTFHLYLYPR